LFLASEYVAENYENKSSKKAIEKCLATNEEKGIGKGLP